MIRNVLNISGLIILVLCISCNPYDDASKPPTIFIVHIDSVQVSSEAQQNDPVVLRLYGIIGSNLCYKFNKFEAKKTDSRLDLTVYGIVPNLKGIMCATMISELRGEDRKRGKEFIISPPLSDPFLVVVHQPNGSTIERTIRVNSK